MAVGGQGGGRPVHVDVDRNEKSDLGGDRAGRRHFGCRNNCGIPARPAGSSARRYT
jgi:hypothetical protein